MKGCHTLPRAATSRMHTDDAVETSTRAQQYAYALDCRGAGPGAGCQHRQACCTFLVVGCCCWLSLNVSPLSFTDVAAVHHSSDSGRRFRWGFPKFVTRVSRRSPSTRMHPRSTSVDPRVAKPHAQCFFQPKRQNRVYEISLEKLLYMSRLFGFIATARRP